MYRSISPQIKSIYCYDSECNQRCGRFHKSSSAGMKRPKPAPKPAYSLDIPTTSALDLDHHRLSVSNSNEPISPFSTASTITLDDIIASARRKTSADFRPIILPSPVFLEQLPPDEPYFRTDSRSSMDGINELEEDFVKHLIDSESEDEYWNGDPTSLIVDDEELADFEELLKATQQPQDHYSNPIDRPADPLKKRQKRLKGDVDDSSSIDLSVADIDPEVLSLYNQQFTALTTVRSNPQYEGPL